MSLDSETIKSFRDLLDYWEAENPSDLENKVYEATRCGASISIHLKDGRIFHDGDNKDLLTGDEDLHGFTIQTIIKGSEATIDSDMFVLPCKISTIKQWVTYMDDEVDCFLSLEREGSFFAKIRIYSEEHGFFCLTSTGNEFEWEADITDEDIPSAIRKEVSSTVEAVLENSDDSAISYFPEMEWTEDKCIKRAPAFTTPSGFAFKAWFFEHSDPDIASYT